MPFVADKDSKDRLPLICGTVKRFLLFGDHDGDVFATQAARWRLFRHVMSKGVDIFSILSLQAFLLH